METTVRPGGVVDGVDDGVEVRARSIIVEEVDISPEVVWAWPTHMDELRIYEDQPAMNISRFIAGQLMIRVSYVTWLETSNLQS